jgi:type IV pilus assembly protein PilW
MAPVVITVGAAGAPDQITVVSGSSSTVAEGAAFVGGAASGADLPLKNAAGFMAGDLVVASETGLNCSMAEVTGFVPAAVNTIQHDNGIAYNYTDVNGATVNPTAKYNKGGGSGVDYSPAALLFSLGRSPSVVTYSVGGDKLQTTTLLPYLATPNADIGDGIVQLKAVYGKDTNADGVVDAWNTTQPVDAATWLQVRAVRLALLARSGKLEKLRTDGAHVTPAAPTWNGGTAFTMINLADGTDWHDYRYRVYETIVPLRNMIWSND